MVRRTTAQIFLPLVVSVALCGCGDDGPSVVSPPQRSARIWRLLADSTGDWPTIQEAIDRAQAGDTIAVAAGVFRERLLVDKPVRLLGGWDADFTGRDPEARETILDGEFLGTVVTLRNLPDTTAVFDGFVVIHGGGGEGGRKAPGAGLHSADTPPGSGIYCDNASCIVSRNTVRDNAAGFGAGILCHRGALRLRFNTVTGNVAAEDGGGILCLEFEGELAGNRVSGNVAGGDGGGVYVLLSGGSLRGDHVFDNQAGGNGGGILCRHSGVVLDSVTVEGNSAGSSGGGLFVEGECAPHFVSCEIAENTTDGRGGGVACRNGCAPVFTSCVLRSNSAADDGGGMYAASVVTLVRTRLLGNGADRGGGVVCAAGGLVAARRCLFAQNTAATGAAVSVERSSRASFYRNTLVDNRASTAGSGFYLVGGETNLEANLIVSAPEGEGIYCWPAAVVELLGNDVWNNAGGDYGGACPEPPDPDPNGNFSADPLFCDPGAGDYTLQASSPAVVAEGDTVGAFPCGCARRKGDLP